MAAFIAYKQNNLIEIFMTKLVLVRQKYTPSGGAERFVSRALQALQTHQSLDVHLIARKWEQVDGIEAHLLDPFYIGSVWRDASFSRAARKFWTQNNFDLVQSHERIAGCHVYRAGDGVHAHWLHLRNESRGFLGKVAHFFNPYHHYVKRAEKVMFLDPALKLVICNSQMIKKEIQQYFGLPESKFAVIYNGVDTKIFSPDLKQQYRQSIRQELSIADETPVLLFVGSGFARKGVARALYSLQAASNIELIVVGKDKHEAKYHALANQLGVANRCHFVGEKKDVKPYLGSADAFILPTLYDPFPNACVEALASGLPVITSTTCGVAEMIIEGGNGFIADALDLNSWQKSVAIWLQAHQNKPKQLSKNAAQSVAHLTLEAMSEEMLSLYQRLLTD